MEAEVTPERWVKLILVKSYPIPINVYLQFHVPGTHKESNHNALNSKN